MRSLPRRSWVQWPRLGQVFRGRGLISRRFFVTSLPHPVLSEPSPASWWLASHLTGPFRASCFTPREPPLDATAQRLIACLDRRWRFPLIPSPRFMAHLALQLPLELGEEAPVRALRDNLLWRR